MNLSRIRAFHSIENMQTQRGIRLSFCEVHDWWTISHMLWQNQIQRLLMTYVSLTRVTWYSSKGKERPLVYYWHTHAHARKTTSKNNTHLNPFFNFVFPLFIIRLIVSLHSICLQDSSDFVSRSVWFTLFIVIWTRRFMFKRKHDTLELNNSF